MKIVLLFRPLVSPLAPSPLLAPFHHRTTLFVAVAVGWEQNFLLEAPEEPTVVRSIFVEKDLSSPARRHRRPNPYSQQEAKAPTADVVAVDIFVVAASFHTFYETRWESLNNFSLAVAVCYNGCSWGFPPKKQVHLHSMAKILVRLEMMESCNGHDGRLSPWWWGAGAAILKRSTQQQRVRVPNKSCPIGWSL